MRPTLFLLLPLSLIAGSLALPLRGAQNDAPATGTTPDPEVEKQRQAAERFLTVLEKTPRRGTALDRLYGYHVEAG
ncbi:MAG: hypothetical protein HY290_25755, partial [Planctomycetia bacterium]|nr:hypothetical protein [Planctomycetia bacterium]